MKTLLIRGEGPMPPQFREIIRGGSTEMKEVRSDDVRDPSTFEPDRVVIWDRDQIEVRGGHDRRESTTKLRWPQDEEKLRMFFQTGG
jgi:hypothetical protein